MRSWVPAVMLVGLLCVPWAAGADWVTADDFKRLQELKRAPQARSGLEAPTYGYADIKKTIEASRAEFDALIEREFLPKIAADIKVILEEALEVSYGFQSKRSRDGYFWGWNCNL